MKLDPELYFMALLNMEFRAYMYTHHFLLKRLSAEMLLSCV